MSQKKLDDLYKELYFKEETTEQYLDFFAEASKPEAVSQRRLRQSAQPKAEDARDSLQGEQAAASSSGSINAQGDLGQHRRKKRKTKIELKEYPYVQYEPPSGTANKEEPEPQSDE